MRCEIAATDCWHKSSFLFYDTATTEIYTLSLHDALPISSSVVRRFQVSWDRVEGSGVSDRDGDRSEEHTSELQSHSDLVCRLLLEKKKKIELRSKPKQKKKRRIKI